MSKQLSSAILAHVLCNTGVVSGARAKPRRRGRRTAAPCIRHARSTHEAAGELVRMQVRTRQHTSSHLLDPPSRARARTRMHTCSYARSIMPNPVTVTVGRKIGASTAIAQKLVYCGSEEGRAAIICAGRVGYQDALSTLLKLGFQMLSDGTSTTVTLFSWQDSNGEHIPRTFSKLLWDCVAKAHGLAVCFACQPNIRAFTVGQKTAHHVRKHFTREKICAVKHLLQGGDVVVLCWSYFHWSFVFLHAAT